MGVPPMGSNRGETPVPPIALPKTNVPRFVVLKHETPARYERPTHWDFMLEAAGALVTWALSEEPSAVKTIAAEKLADHRPHYLDYEGPVSGDRGFVTRFDAGEYDSLTERDGERVIMVRGAKLVGRATISREPGTANRWTFFIEPGSAE